MPDDEADLKQGDEETTQTEDAPEQTGDETEPSVDLEPPAGGMIETDEPEPDDKSDTEEPAPEATEHISKDPFDAALLARAKLAGMTEEQAREYGEPTHLRRTLDLFNKRFADIGQRHLERAKQQFGQQTPAPQTTPTPPAAPSPPPPTPAPLKIYEPGLEGYDDEVRSEFTKLHENLSQQIAQVVQAVGMLAGGMQRQAGEPYEREWNEAVAKTRERLGEHASKIDVNKLRQQAIALGRGYVDAGLPAPRPADLCPIAMELVHGDLLRELEQDQLAEQVSKREKQFTTPPTGRKQAPITGDERAARYADNYVKSNVLVRS
jgi:hypothetical protein